MFLHQNYYQYNVHNKRLLTYHHAFPSVSKYEENRSFSLVLKHMTSVNDLSITKSEWSSLTV